MGIQQQEAHELYFTGRILERKMVPTSLSHKPGNGQIAMGKIF